MVVVKILYMIKRERTDLETVIPLLCRRVSKIYADNWKKLKRVLLRVKETIYDKNIIGAKIIADVYTWIDADYAVHSEIKSHSGGRISMGYGLLQ